MSSFTPPGSAGRWQTAKQMSGRVPLRIKLITAVLALVVIALTGISVASISLFRDYQLNRASQQVTALFDSTYSQLGGPYGLQPGHEQGVNGYFIALRPAGSRLTQPPTLSSIPNIPVSRAWLSANSGKLVDVSAVTGKDNWRVITKEVDFGPFGENTLIVGVDLGDINGTIGQLTYIDLVVSAIVVVALAMAGVGIVRSSMRPLREIEYTAAAIAAGDLSRRVPEGDPRTEVGQLGRALNSMLTQIESAFRARERSETAARRSEERIRQFVSDASHELRTPLTAIRGYAEYYRQRGGLDNGSREPSEQGRGEPERDPAHQPVLAGTPGESSPLTKPDMDRIMERVEQESSRMGELVEDMLILARLDEQRPIERRPVDLLSLAADAVQDARIVAPGRTIELTVGTSAAFLVLGDEPRLRQVIGNLMNNALTHTPEGTPVTVRILAGYQGSNPAVPAVILEVADQGPGLSREQAEHVFERFYRAWPGDRLRPGRRARRHRRREHRPGPGRHVLVHAAPGPRGRRRSGQLHWRLSG
jgi:two-component system OmpR family sensor kinase